MSSLIDDGRTYAKFHSSPSAQSSLQKPSLMSHFAMNIFASVGAVANAWMMRWRECPSWSIAPAGANFVVVLFTDGIVSVGLSLIANDKSRIARKGLDLCGTMASGEILSCGGGLSFMSVHRTKRACLLFNFAVTSSSICAMAFGDSADACGPLSTAACIWRFDHGRPVIAGHPFVEYSSSTSAAGW